MWTKLSARKTACGGKIEGKGNERWIGKSHESGQIQKSWRVGSWLIWNECKD